MKKEERKKEGDIFLFFLSFFLSSIFFIHDLLLLHIFISMCSFMRYELILKSFTLYLKNESFKYLNLFGFSFKPLKIVHQTFDLPCKNYVISYWNRNKIMFLRLIGKIVLVFTKIDQCFIVHSTPLSIFPTYHFILI